MAAVCRGRVMLVVVFCTTLMGLANCSTIAAPAATTETTTAAAAADGGNKTAQVPDAAGGNDTATAAPPAKTTAVAATTQPLTVEEQLDAINKKLKTVITRCKVCFREVEGSDQCQGALNTCSGWSSPGMAMNETVPEWSEEFRDDTDKRPGGCKYQWRLICE